MRQTERKTVWLQALKKDGLISDRQYARLAEVPGDNRHPFEWLCAQQLYPSSSLPVLQEDNLLRWLSKHSGLERTQINPLELDLKSVTDAIPMRFARHHEILALQISDEELRVACADPFQVHQWHSELSIALNRKISIYLVHPKDMQIHLNALYPLHHSISHVAAANQNNIELELPTFLALDESDDNESATTLTNRLLRYALERRASDIHIEPRETLTQIRLRIDGVLHHLIYLPHSVAQVFNHRLKVLAHMDTTEKRRPQDGHLRIMHSEGQYLELRLSTMATAYGEKLVLRLLSPHMLQQDYTLLGMDTHTQQIWHQIIEQHNGLILVTGPTGSGKTTTLYNTLYRLDSAQCNICTVEDPIEMIEPHFNQTQVRPELNLDFADNIRALLRQDPDVIMVGEIRDHATAAAAIQAALTGHQVFSTMHTNDSIAAIVRLSDIGISDYLIRATLAGVINQRLVARLCPDCKQERGDSAKLCRQFFGEKHSKLTLYSAQGCVRCRYTGIHGRVGIFETLLIDEDLRNCISSANLEGFALACKQSKRWRPLYNSVIAQLKAGAINVESVHSLLRL